MTRVVRSGQLAQGREVRALEREMAERLGLAHAVAVSSGTAALHLALLALGAGPRMRVLSPSYVCAAVLNAIRYTGARERLIDCAPRAFGIDAEQAARQARGAVAAIVPHLFGGAAALDPLLSASVPVIEDCAMALGAEDGTGAPLGRRGRCSVFSFYATKSVAGGEGGLLATDDRALADDVRDRREYDKKDRFRLRFSYKLTDLQAAVVRVQLARLRAHVAARRAVARAYRAELDPRWLELPADAPGHSWYRFVLRWAGGFERAAWHFERAGIDVARPVYRPLHTLLGLPSRRFPESENRFLTAISLPVYPDLTDRDRRRIVAVANRLADPAAGHPPRARRQG